MRGKERLTRSITVQVTEREYCSIKEAAERAGTSVSILIIDSINEHTGIQFQEREAHNRYTKEVRQ